MKKVMMIVLSMMSTLMFGQPISFQWASAFSGLNQEAVKVVKTDSAGQVYAAGYFTGSMDADPGSGVQMLTSAGLQDIFILKLNPAGQLLWAKRIGGSGNDMVYDLQLDPQSNIHICGFFSNSVDFDPAPTQYILHTTATNSQDIFLAKYSSNGVFNWAKSAGGGSYMSAGGSLQPAVCVAYSLGITSSGNILMSGSILGNVDFDPTAGVQLLSAFYSPSLFVSKYTSSGNLIWAKHLTGSASGNGSEGYCLAIDQYDNSYVGGVFTDSLDADPGPGVYPLYSVSHSSSLMLKLDANGNFIWANTFGGNTISDQSSIRAMQIDIYGRINLGGHYKGSIDLDPGPGYTMAGSAGNFDIFLVQLSASGDRIWSKRLGGQFADYCHSISINPAQHIYVCGGFRGTVDFNPGAGTDYLSSTSFSAQDAFMLKLDADGNYKYAVKAGGSQSDLAQSVCATTNGNVIVGGNFSGLADLNLTEAFLQVQAIGSGDGFISCILESAVISTTLNPENADEGYFRNSGSNQIETHHACTEFDMKPAIEYHLHKSDSSIPTQYKSVDTGTNWVDDHTNREKLSLNNSEILTQSGIHIYPNPTTGSFTVNLREYKDDMVLRVFNLSGQTLLKKFMKGREITLLDLHHYPSGNYYLVCASLPESENKYISNPILIQLIK
jgi:hypothetical protein